MFGKRDLRDGSVDFNVQVLYTACLAVDSELICVKYNNENKTLYDTPASRPRLAG